MKQIAKPSAATIRFTLILLSALALTAPRAGAISSTDQAASPGKPVRAEPGWPEGVLDLVNDPLRTDGWNPWFSEWPNDVNHYAFEVANTDEVNRLIEKLTAIKAKRLVVALNPTMEARGLGFTTVLPEGNGAGVVFSIGNQKRMDEWYQRLPEIEPGVRKFGVQRYGEVPVARSPTLTLYVGHEAVDLNKLKIPGSVEVISDAVPAGKAPEETVKAIEQFLANRRSNLAQPASAAKTDRAAELKFLSDIPEFREFNLKLTEERLKELVSQHHLSAKVHNQDGKRSYRVFRSDGENVIIGFRGGECTGVQRMRRDVEGLAKLRESDLPKERSTSNP